jgi:hypothetical protein
LFSLVRASADGNLDVRFNCETSNCSLCEIELTDITPDQCTLKIPGTDTMLPYPVKVWYLGDIGTCDATKRSITILIVIILFSVFGFIAGIAIVRILYIRQYFIKSGVSSLATFFAHCAAHGRELIRDQNLASRLKTLIVHVMIAGVGWLWQLATDIGLWLRNSMGWRFSKARVQPVFGDLVEFVLVCFCGATCKWWSEIWAVRPRIARTRLHSLA